MLLTFRQIATLWERYWDRTLWQLTHQSKLSGLGLLRGGSSATKPEAGSGSNVIDATTDEGIMEMVGRGLPVKFIPAQQG